jgi:hypothetical protein
LSQNIEYDVIEGEVGGVQILEDLFLDIEQGQGVWKRKIIAHLGQVFGIDYLVTLDGTILEVTHKFPMKKTMVVSDEYHKAQDDEGVRAT